MPYCLIALAPYCLTHVSIAGFLWLGIHLGETDRPAYPRSSTDSPLPRSLCRPACSYSTCLLPQSDHTVPYVLRLPRRRLYHRHVFRQVNFLIPDDEAEPHPIRTQWRVLFLLSSGHRHRGRWRRKYVPERRRRYTKQFSPYTQDLTQDSGMYRM